MAGGRRAVLRRLRLRRRGVAPARVALVPAPAAAAALVPAAAAAVVVGTLSRALGAVATLALVVAAQVEIESKV